MGLERFDIVLDQSKPGELPSYSTGQTITGSVLVWNQEKETLYGLYLEADGKAKVRWNEPNGDDSTSHSSKEHYFHHRTPLDQHPIGQRFELLPGRHKYPFVVTLPSDVPSSFEGKHGNVRYTLKAVVKRSWYKHDFICEIPIIVHSVVDLNTELEHVLTPPSKTECKEHIGFSTSGQITANTWLDRKGYIPGETILYSAKIDNHSGRTVDSTTVQFIRRENYTAKKEKTTYKKILWEETRGKIRDGTTMRWDDFPIVVPSVPPSGLPHCNIIDIEYEIKLIVDPGLLSSNLVATLSVFIGTVPFQSLDSCDPQTLGSSLDATATTTICPAPDLSFTVNNGCLASGEPENRTDGEERINSSTPLETFVNMSIDPTVEKSENSLPILNEPTPQAERSSGHDYCDSELAIKDTEYLNQNPINDS